MSGRSESLSRTILLAILLCAVLATVNAAVKNPLPTIKEYFDAQNGVRTNPTDMATFITTEYKANVPAGSKTHSIWLLTFNEACPAVFDEAINYLNAFTPVGALQVDLGMTYAAWKHAKWMVEQNGGSLSHTGPGGNSFSDRLKEFTTKTMGAAGENILYTGSGYVTGKIMVAQYIIDDGVSGRGHRTNIMTTSFKKTGLGLFYDSAKSRYYQVTVLSDSYTCDKCDTITCQMQKDCGWSQYLKDAGLTDPCAAVTPTPTDPAAAGSGTPTGTTPTATGTESQKSSSYALALLSSSLSVVASLIISIL